MHFHSSFYCQMFLLLCFWGIDCRTAEETSFPLFSCDPTSNVQKISSDHPSQGLLTSAGYPRAYPPNQQCMFELSVPPKSGLVIHLIFLDLDLNDVFSKSGQCLRDYILFTITDREGREHIGERMCGGKYLPEPMRAMQPQVKVLFVTSLSKSQKRGFKIRYEFTAEASIMAPPSFYYDPNLRFRKDCGGSESDADALSGHITSPGFPYTYPRNVTCNWLIRVRPNKRIYVRLLHLELSLTMAECERASLVIIDGYRHEVEESSARKFSTKSSPEIKYCGGHLYYNEEGMKSYLSTSNRVLIRFVTKDNPSSDQVEIYEQEGTPIGFRLLWTEIDSLVINLNLNDGSADCPGFLCQGGEFCVDDGHNICAERTRLCINKTLQCDGISNCAENDNSDEFYCYSQNPLTLAGVASALFLLLLLLLLLLFTYRTHSRYKRKQKHRQIESTRREYSEKMAATAAKSTAVHSTQKLSLLKTPIKLQTEKEDHANVMVVKHVKQRTPSVSSTTSNSMTKPKTTSICKLKTSPQLSVYSRLDVSNGLSNTCINQTYEPAVWQMASHRLQTDRSRREEYRKEEEEMGGKNKDAFAQSIYIIQRALV